MADSVLNLILSHQSSHAVDRMLTYWKRHVPERSLLLAYGGPREEYARIAHARKYYVEDERLRTRDHQREFQSYTGLLRQASEFMRTTGPEFCFLYFAEYDHLPLVPELNARQLELLAREGADVLAHHLHRVDQTNNAHWLNHSSETRFPEYWDRMSCRRDRRVVLSMVGTGSFWTREAFLEVTSHEEPFPMYLEIYLPTLAHHLGYRVRGLGEQDRYVRVVGDETANIAQAGATGAWTLHPVKHLWTE